MPFQSGLEQHVLCWEPVLLKTVKVAVLECEYPMVGNFRKVIEYASDDVLEWVYEYLLSQKHDVPDTIELIGPHGIASHSSESIIDGRFGWGCYHAALYNGFLVDRGIPLFEYDKNFWEDLLAVRPRSNLEYAGLWQDEWR